MRSVRARAAVAALVLMVLTESTGQGAQVRFHYVPDPTSATSSTLVVAGGTAGELSRWSGAVPEPAAAPPRATHVVTYRHPNPGRNISVPIAFPEGTPRIEYARSRIVYNYGSFS